MNNSRIMDRLGLISIAAISTFAIMLAVNVVPAQDSENALNESGSDSPHFSPHLTFARPLLI